MYLLYFCPIQILPLWFPVAVPVQSTAKARHASSGMIASLVSIAFLSFATLINGIAMVTILLAKVIPKFPAVPDVALSVTDWTLLQPLAPAGGTILTICPTDSALAGWAYVPTLATLSASV